MKGRTSCRFCGQPVAAAELELIRETVRDCSGLSHTELAYTVCELLEWRRPNGSLKGHECRQFLEGLEAQGVLRLPGKKGNPQRCKDKPTDLENERRY